MAGHPLGYSVRGGSLGGQALRDAFRRLERCGYYYLPVDTPPREKESATPHTAPLRMFYLPDVDGWRVAGQVAYREKDTAGRTGAYFAHVLAGPAQLSVASCQLSEGMGLEVLRAWKAGGWEIQDGEHLAHELPTVASVRELMGNEPPAIQDAVLVSFLTAEAGGAFFDPGKVVSARWWRMSVVVRQMIFKSALAGLLGVLEERNSPVILVAEPEAAALLFYGLLRFLPGKVAEKIGFSTYEPQPDRVMTKLAGTTFWAPEESDLREEMYQGRGFTLNTFNGRMSERAAVAAERPRRDSAYVENVFGRFLRHGMADVERYGAMLDAVGAVTAADLNALGEVEKIADRILPPTVTPPPVPGEAVQELPDSYAEMPISASRTATVYLRRCLTERLARVENPETELAAVVGTARHSLLAELLGAGTEDSRVRAAMQFLIGSLTETQIPLWIQNAPVAEEIRARVLHRWVQNHGKLPAGCEFLLTQGAALDSRRDADTPSLSLLLLRLSETEQEKVFAEAEAAGFEREFLLAFSHGLSGMMDRQGATDAAVLAGRDRLDALVQRVSAQTLLTLHRDFGAWFFTNYPGNSEVLGRILQGFVPQLPGDLSRDERVFREKYGLLADAQEVLEPDGREKVRKWKELLETVSAVVSLQADPAAKKKCANMKLLEGRCQKMASLAREVLEESRIHAQVSDVTVASVVSPAAEKKTAKVMPVARAAAKEFSPAERQQIAREQLRLLRRLAEFHTGKTLLPAQAWQNAQLMKKVESCLLTKTWSLKKVGYFSGKGRAAQNWMLIGVGGVCMGLLAAILFFLMQGAGSRNQSTQREPVPELRDQGSGIRGQESGEPSAEKSSAGGKMGMKPEKNEDETVLEKKNVTEKKGAEKVSAKNEVPVKNPSGKENAKRPGKKTEDDFPDDSGDSLNLDAHLRKAGVKPEDDFPEEEDFADGEEDEYPDDEDWEDVEPGDEEDTKTSPAVSEKRLSPPTSAETRMKWDSWLRRQARDKMGIYQQVPLRAEPAGNGIPEKNASAPGLSRAVSRQDIRTLTKLSAEDLKTLQMNGGYLIFEETAYPFGVLPEEFSSVSAGMPAGESGAGRESAKSENTPRKSHVLKEDELQEDSQGAVTLKEKKVTVDISGIRYEVPRLGESLGLAAVVVRLEPRDDGTTILAVEGVRRAVSQADRERQENRLAEVERKRDELRTLRGHIRMCETSAKDGTSAKKTEENIIKMLKFLGMDEKSLPVTAERPSRENFSTQRAYETEVEHVRQADEARTRVIRNLIVRAKDESTRREEELRNLETQIDRVQGKLTAAEVSAFSRLSKNGTQVNVVFSKSDGFPLGASGGESPFRMLGEMKKEPGGPFRERNPRESDFSEDDIPEDPFADDIPAKTEAYEIPEESPVTSGKKSPADAPRLLPVKWKFSEKDNTMKSLLKGGKAIFSLNVETSPKKDASHLAKFVVNCEGVERLGDKEEKSFPLNDILSQEMKEPHPLLPDSGELMIRLVFLPKKENSPLGETHPPAFRTRWFYIGPIQDGKRYQVTVQLDSAAVEMLRGGEQVSR